MPPPPDKHDVTRSITFTYPHRRRGRDYYRVIEVENSIEFTPDDLLSQAQVSALCDDADWNAKILPKRIVERAV